jgi:uncharacterized protein (DUF1684 family)
MSFDFNELRLSILFVKIGQVWGLMMRRGKIVSILLITGVLLMAQGMPATTKGEDQKEMTPQEQRVMKWRKERDLFFKSHQRSPLLPQDKKAFKGLRYYPFDPKYIFSGELERFVFHINNPKYYATFLTNKGTNKRYLRYGRFHFTLDGREYTIEIYKSILSDTLFIPFKDETNEKETYEGGRYIDAEILPDYRMVLDFNMAYHPSCAYNEKFVCALPPRENMLDVEIRAGERNLKSAGHQGLKSQVNPVVTRKSGAALLIPISNPTSQMILSVIE